MYVYKKNLAIRLTIFKHTKLNHDNIIRLLALNENTTSIGFTADSLNLKKINQIHNDPSNISNVSFKLKGVSPDWFIDDTIFAYLYINMCF